MLYALIKIKRNIVYKMLKSVSPLTRKKYLNAPYKSHIKNNSVSISLTFETVSALCLLLYVKHLNTYSTA